LSLPKARRRARIQPTNQQNASELFEGSSSFGVFVPLGECGKARIEMEPRRGWLPRIWSSGQLARAIRRHEDIPASETSAALGERVTV
jgi:hypothetical protein